MLRLAPLWLIPESCAAPDDVAGGFDNRGHLLVQLDAAGAVFLIHFFASYSFCNGSLLAFVSQSRSFRVVVWSDATCESVTRIAASFAYPLGKSL